MHACMCISVSICMWRYVGARTQSPEWPTQLRLYSVLSMYAYLQGLMSACPVSILTMSLCISPPIRLCMYLHASVFTDAPSLACSYLYLRLATSVVVECMYILALVSPRFVYTGEAGSEDKKRREPSLLDLEPHGRTRDEQEGEEEEEEKEEREKEKGDPGGEEEEKKKQFEESLNAFVYKTDMGEQLQGHREGRLFLTDFRRRTTQMLQPPRDRFSCGQVRWTDVGTNKGTRVLVYIYRAVR